MLFLFDQNGTKLSNQEKLNHEESNFIPWWYLTVNESDNLVQMDKIRNQYIFILHQKIK